MGNKNNASLVRTPYDNYKMIHPDGTLMCFCSKKKAKWYETRGLATLNGYNVHLSFIPNGYGDPSIILEGRENCCVISGETNFLTKHHVIPTQYRKFFSNKYKDKNSSDLVVLTRKMHDKYELTANVFKDKLYLDYISVDLINRFYEISEAKSLYRTLSKHLDKIPATKQIYMQMKLEGILERTNLSTENLEDINFDPYENTNKMIVSKIGEINLIILWKLHFIKYGKPKHMPNWWKPNLIKIIKSKKDLSEKSELIEVDMQEEKLLQLIIKYDLYETAKLYF